MSDIKMDLPLLRPLEPHRWLRRRRWELMADWEFDLTLQNARIHIPAGFIFDGASIPRLLTAVFSPVGILLIPALLHDWAYQHKFMLVNTGRDLERWWQLKPRQFFDDMFFDAARQLYGRDKLLRLPWLGVRLFGGGAWRKRCATLK